MWKLSHLTSFSSEMILCHVTHLLQCQLMHNRCEMITYRSVLDMHWTACTSTLQYMFHQTKSGTNSDDWDEPERALQYVFHHVICEMVS